MNAEGFPDGSSSAPAPAQSSSPVAVCPKCGYKAFSPDDQLATAHQGEGECPSCGIIPSRFDRSRVQHPEEPEPEISQARAEVPARRMSFPFKPVVIGLIFVAAIAYWFTRDNQTGAEQAQLVQETPEGSKGTERNVSAAASILTVLPGEEKEFVISGYLPFLHSAETEPLDMEPTWKVTVNDLEERGVRVTPAEGKISSETCDVWTFSPEGEDQWRCVRPDRQMSFARKFMVGAFGPNPQPPEQFRNIIGCNNVWELKKFSQTPQQKVEELLAELEGGANELKKDTAHLYRADLKFSIRLFGNELTADSPIRIGLIAFKLMGAKAGNSTMSIGDGIQFEIRHDADQEGITLKQPSRWELRYSD